MRFQQGYFQYEENWNQDRSTERLCKRQNREKCQEERSLWEENRKFKEEHSC